MKNVLRIYGVVVIVVFGLLTISSEKTNSLFVINASAQTCMSTDDCTDTYNHGTIGDTNYCCILPTGDTGHKQGIVLPGKPTP